MNEGKDCTFRQLEVKVWKVALNKWLECPKQAKLLTGVWYQTEEAGHPSRDDFLPIKFFAQHAYGRPRKFSRSESSGSNFWFSFVSVQRIELKSIPVVWCEDILSWKVDVLKVSLS